MQALTCIFKREESRNERENQNYGCTNGTITYAWDNIPLSGTYKIYSEAIGWNKQMIKSDEVIIIVNNIIQEEEEEGEAE